MAIDNTMRDADAMVKAARTLLASGHVGDELLRQSAVVSHALVISTPEGEAHSWFIPLTIGDQLVAFFQFLRDGTLMRFSSFQRRSGVLDDCPAAADWLDRDHIRARVTVQRQDAETAREPFLTYDRTPDRLVWAVPLVSSEGHVHLAYVAGETVYMPPSDDRYG